MDKTRYRPTWSEIDLGAVRYNLNRIREFVDNDVAIMAVVKANAYGHGINEVSSVLIADNVDYLGVATVDEAMELRAAGIKTPVLILGSILEEEARVAMANNITITLGEIDLLGILVKLAKETGIRPKVHVKVDTGMGRLGVWHSEAASFIRKVKQEESIELEGIFTHFSSAARDNVITEIQINSFEDIIREITDNGIRIKYCHAANSIGIIDWKRSHMNLVRTGILLYGVYPKESFRKTIDLASVLSLKTRIVHLKDMPAGRSISYGRTYITQKPTKMATIPIGYADGYGRILSNKAEALIRGQHVRVVGMVTMDQTVLDVGHIKDVKIGDEVVLIGRQGDAEIPIEKVAKLSGTIPYEILSGITERVPRIYKN